MKEKIVVKNFENHILPFLWMRGEEKSVIIDEMEKIYECGIGAVCVEARPHDDYCGPGWWHDLDIIIDEAEKRNMKIWILDDKHFPTGYANGLIESKYPERKKTYINYTTADVFGSGHKVTLNIKRMMNPVVKFWEIGKPVNEEERKNNQLVSIVAMKYHGGNVFCEYTIDLTDKFDGEFATLQLPEGQWRISVVYKTKTDGGNESYINLIDKVSAYTQIEGVYEAHYNKYKEKFGKVIAGFFSDEPQFGNLPGFSSDAIVGKKEMPLPWSDELKEMLEEKYGKELYEYLPYLWNSSNEMQICPQLRFDYMDCVSKLYEKNFSNTIGNWCEEHGVEYIGHVVEDDGAHSRLGMGAAHYFRAMSGQHMAGIDCIGGQIVYGAPDLMRKSIVNIDGEFNHFALGKLGASCGHLDPKKNGRTMCELFGAYGWKFGVRDMKYVLDHLLVKGVNYLVPHAFSMAEYPDHDCPPHFYARGNNPQFKYFADLMKYANRMCNLLSGGRHVASVSVLYDGEAEWAGNNMPMQKVCRQLIENQIDFDIVSTDMLVDYKRFGTKVNNAKLKINNEEFSALIIPYTQRITKELQAFIDNNIDLPVLFIDMLPEAVVNNHLDENKISEAVRECTVINLDKLANVLREKGYYDISIEGEFKELSYYHYVTNCNIFMLQNESSNKEFHSKITLPTNKKLVIYNGFEEKLERLNTEILGNKSQVMIHLYPAESCIIMEMENIEELNLYIPQNKQIEECKDKIDISNDWYVSKVRQKQYPDFNKPELVNKLYAISDKDPKFAGVICYEKEIQLREKIDKAYIQFEYVYESMSLWINGELVGKRIAPPYELEIGKYLVKGNNKIKVEVATTLDRDQLNYPKPPFDLYHEVMEPTGIYGDIFIKFK